MIQKLISAIPRFFGFDQTLEKAVLCRIHGKAAARLLYESEKRETIGQLLSAIKLV